MYAYNGTYANNAGGPHSIALGHAPATTGACRAGPGDGTVVIRGDDARQQNRQARGAGWWEGPLGPGRGYEMMGGGGRVGRPPPEKKPVAERQKKIGRLQTIPLNHLSR